MTKRILTTIVALGMVIGLLAGAIGSASATNAASIPSWIFFPSVPNGQSIEGTNPWYGSITIQNTENDAVDIHFATTATNTPLTGPSATLDAHASQTFSAASLFANLTGSPTNSGFAVEATWNSIGNHTVAPVISGVEKQATPESNAFGVNTSTGDLIVDGYTAIQMPDVAFGSSSTICTTPTSGCNDLGANFLGVSITDFGTNFSSDGTSYLPIVQANWSGWNTMLNVTNIDASTPANTSAQVTVKFFQAGSGSQVAGTWTGNIAAGKTAQIDVAGQVGTSGFVGSAQISSAYAMVANAVRVKSSTNMAVINTSAPSLLTTTKSSKDLTTVGDSKVPVMYPEESGSFSLNAPLVFRNYSGWNTGINIVNISPASNEVTVTFFDRSGNNVDSSKVTIPAMGMDYVYIPALATSGTSDFGQATIAGTGPLYAAVDEVKYSTGDAMSYMATGSTIDNAGSVTNPKTLALALFQNGNVSTSDSVEHGDTSGINLQDPGSVTATGTISFYQLNGTLLSLAASETSFSIPANGGTYVYAQQMTDLPANSQLTAIVTANTGIVSAVSNDVNYDVNGDGGSVFNLSSPFGQYRFGCSASACGIQAISTAPSS